MNRLAHLRTWSRRFAALTLLLLPACTDTPTDQPSDGNPFELLPARVTLFARDTMTFELPDSIGDVEWSVASGPGAIDDAGHYVAPSSIAGDSVVATIEARMLEGARRRGVARVTLVADTTRRVCFERDVRPIMRGTCAAAGCHDPGVRQKGYNFTDDVIVQRATRRGDPEGSILYHVISHDDHHRMPPEPRPRLQPHQIATIGSWIDQGSQLTPCPTPGVDPCDTTDASWSGDIRPILDASCTSCHFAGSPGGIDLVSLDGVRAVAASGQLLGSINHSPGYVRMPSDSVRLPECEILTIQAWIDANMPDN